jgi:hypothetical protein
MKKMIAVMIHEEMILLHLQYDELLIFQKMFVQMAIIAKVFMMIPVERCLSTIAPLLAIFIQTNLMKRMNMLFEMT